ncbi:MAG TPA: hypothetical protein PLG73_13070 [Candidatus Sumerlaeota bacterium]|nr:hypothetical protein [Candidatus Sumerlaeota bacterium]
MSPGHDETTRAPAGAFKPLCDRLMPPLRLRTFFQPAWLPGLASLLLLGLMARVNRVHGTTGDEPHYLVMMDSLVRDGDLLILNNHEREITRDFFGEQLAPHLSHAAPDRSLHFPMTALLLAPAYALDRHDGVLLLLVLLHACAVLWLRAALIHLGIAPAAASAVAFVWLLTVPWSLMALQVYPDSVGLVLVAAVLRLLVGKRWPILRPILIGLLLGILAALHIKFYPLAIALLVGGIWLGGVRRAWPVMLFPFLLVVALNSILLARLYGSIWPWAPYGSFASHGAGGSLLLGLPAYLADLQYGLLPQGPLWLALVPGVVVLARSRDRGPRGRFAWVCLAAGLIHLLAIANTRLDLFGWSTAARNLTVAVPVGVAIAGLGLQATWRRRGFRWFWALLFVWQLALLVVYQFDWWGRYKLPTLLARWLGVPRESVPSFFDYFHPDAPPDPGAWVLFVAFAAVAIILGVLGWRLGRLSPEDRAALN